MKRLDQMQKMIDAQQKQIESQKKEIGGLNSALGRKGASLRPPEPVAAPAPVAPPAPPPIVETRLQQQDQKIDDVIAKFAAEQDARRLAVQEQPQASVTNGRLQIASADGRFSAALRATVQYDVGYYMQGNHARTLPTGPDLSSGSNFRRAQLGLQGKVFGDWSYYVNIDYGSGGSTGTEAPGHIQQAYIEYDGFGPFIFRIGAHPPSTGLDDSYAASDQLLMERSAPGDLTRNMAGGDGRDSIELLYVGENLYGSFAYTGDKVQETDASKRRTAGGGGPRRLFAGRECRLALGRQPGGHRCVPPWRFHVGVEFGPALRTVESAGTECGRQQHQHWSRSPTPMSRTPGTGIWKAPSPTTISWPRPATSNTASTSAA